MLKSDPNGRQKKRQKDIYLKQFTHSKCMQDKIIIRTIMIGKICKHTSKIIIWEVQLLQNNQKD